MIYPRALGLLGSPLWVEWALPRWSVREGGRLGPDFISVRTVLDVACFFLLLLWRTHFNCLVSKSTPLPTLKKPWFSRLVWYFHDEALPDWESCRCTREERQLKHCSLGHRKGFLSCSWANHRVQQKVASNQRGSWSPAWRGLSVKAIHAPFLPHSPN